jgi:hypothetical protein
VVNSVHRNSHIIFNIEKGSCWTGEDITGLLKIFFIEKAAQLVLFILAHLTLFLRVTRWHCATTTFGVGAANPSELIKNPQIGDAQNPRRMKNEKATGWGKIFLAQRRKVKPLENRGSALRLCVRDLLSN